MTNELAKRSDRPAMSLFEELIRACDGFGHEQVVDASFNMTINAFCQSYKTRDEAVLAWDEMMVRAKDKLGNCYDISGKLKRTYFYNQVFPVNGPTTT